METNQTILVNFTAEPDNSRVMLEWMTTLDTETDYFTLERSKNGLTFEEIAIVPGAGKRQGTLAYLHYDEEPLPGTSYYRLKQTDHDGHNRIFDIVSVQMGAPADPICTLGVRPDPCLGSCNVVLSDCEETVTNEITLNVIDASGCTISTTVPNRRFNGGFNFHMDPGNNLAPSVYIVQAQSIQQAYTLKQKGVLN